MAFDLNNRKTVALAVPYQEDTINLEYKPDVFTPEYRARLDKLAKGESKADERDTDAQMVADLLASWDVVAGGEPYPPIYENLLKVPIALLGAVAFGMLEDMGKFGKKKSKA